jgi:acetyl-CoA C-acetyltransferase
VIDAARTPVIVATGQVVERTEPVDARTLAVRAARRALDDAGAVAAHVQRVTMLSTLFSPGGPTIARQVAAGVGLGAAHAETTSVGGNTPPWLVTRAAEDIARGDLDATLVVGAEAARSARAAGDGGGVRFRANAGDTDVSDADPVVGGSERGYVSRAEVWAGLTYPTVVYPLLESVLAARAGRSFAEQRVFVAGFMARFSEVAARHPCAWFPSPATPTELATPTAGNRLIAEPYPKRMNAFPFVDQAAALVVCSLALARDAGVDDRAVFVWSGADAFEVRTPTARPDLGTAAGLRAAASRTFAAAGVGVDEVDAFDFYCCFPSAVEMAADAVGVALDDPRGLTVTGGLPYFGGPGNNYETHAIATMVDTLRDRGGIGMCTSPGGFMTKHGVTLLGASPPARGFVRGDTDADQARIDASAREVATDDGVDGGATVVANTVVYAADGSVEAAPVVADLDDGRRVAAAADPAVLPDVAGALLVGRRVHVRAASPTWAFAG